MTINKIIKMCKEISTSYACGHTGSFTQVCENKCKTANAITYQVSNDVCPSCK